MSQRTLDVFRHLLRSTSLAGAASPRDLTLVAAWQRHWLEREAASVWHTLDTAPDAWRDQDSSSR